MSSLAIVKRRKFTLTMSLLVCAAMLATGCWGVLLNGRPAGRNRGEHNVAVWLLDIFLTPFCIGLLIDGCAGTLRKPSESQEISALDDVLNKYRALGYAEADGSVKLPESIKVRLQPEEVRTMGDHKLSIVWSDGMRSVELYSGKLKDAQGRMLSTAGISGEGRLEVCLDGETKMAWNTTGTAEATRLATAQ